MSPANSPIIHNHAGSPPVYFPSPASSPQTNLPAYSDAPSNNEVLLSSSPVTNPRSPQGATSYTYSSNRLTLYLGPRAPGGTQAPSYGVGGIVEGWVEMRSSFRHVEKVELTVEGIANVTAVERGFPSGALNKTVLSHVITLYNPRSPTSPPLRSNPASPPSSPSSGTSFRRLSLRAPTSPISTTSMRSTDSSTSSVLSGPGSEAEHRDFSFPLPTYAQGSFNLLPPSFSAIYPGMEASVKYTVRVDMCRSGFRRHERVEAVILYLPKTCPPSLQLPLYSPSAGAPTNGQLGHSQDSSSHGEQTVEVPAYDEPLCKVIQLRSTNPNHPNGVVRDLDTTLSIFQPLSYQAQSPIPFKLTMKSPTPVLPELLIANTTISLVKITAFSLFGECFKRETVLAKSVSTGSPEGVSEGHPWKVDICEREGTVTASGSISGGRERGEVAWKVEGAVEVKYVLRVVSGPPKDSPSLENALPSFNHSQPIELTTHSREEVDTMETVMEGPALGLIGMRRGLL